MTAADAAVCQCGHLRHAHKQALHWRDNPDDTSCVYGYPGKEATHCTCPAFAAAVPDREGATEQLAALLRKHREAQWSDGASGCSPCGHYAEVTTREEAKAAQAIGHMPTYADYCAHVAAVIVAAGWHRMHDLDGVLRELNIHIEEGTA